MPWDYYNYSGPRAARGGIRAQSQRGAFGATWWGRRWMDALTGLGMESRVAKGRSYARSGQVLTLDITGEEIRSTVQGSEVKPYRLRIRLTPFSADDRERLVMVLREDPFLTARLLAGEMPEELEPVLERERIGLFPARETDLDADCSCPDYSNPCKHLAAVYCLLAEEFDRDPFLLFTLRGLDRDALLAALTGDEASEETPEAVLPDEPLPEDFAAFWEGNPDRLPSAFGPLRPPPVAAPLARRLGAFPFWRATEPLADAVAAPCEAASARIRAGYGTAGTREQR